MGGKGGIFLESIDDKVKITRLRRWLRVKRLPSPSCPFLGITVLILVEPGQSNTHSGGSIQTPISSRSPSLMAVPHAKEPTTALSIKPRSAIALESKADFGLCAG